MSSNKSKIEWLHVDDLHVDQTVQRHLRSARVNELVRDWNPDGIGVITVSSRPDGGHFILDGQHRWAAAKQVGHIRLKCEVFTGLSESDEAALFLVRNNTKIVSTFDKFRVRLIEGDPVALGIEKILADNGWKVRINRVSGSGSFSAVAALEWVYNGADRMADPTPKVARQTVEVITAAWGLDPDAVRADLVKGIGLFLLRYGEAIDLSKVVTELTRYGGGPLKVSGDARLLRSMRSMPAADAVATLLTGLYNKKRTVNRLPEWGQK